MIKDKKGYSLVEIIVCISLLALIAVIVIVFNINNDEDKEKKKIISNIVAAADVYGSMNSEIIDKAKDNYGYLVLTIDELKEMGLLDVNQIIPTLSEDEINWNRNVSYDRIVIDTTDRDNVGFINYIYPYYDNDPDIKNLTDLSIEYEEINLFKCNSLLTVETENDGKVVYLDKEYKKVVTSDYKCGIDGTSEEDYALPEGNVINLNEGQNKLEYITNNGITGYRNIIVNDEFEAEIEAYTINDNNPYTCGDWNNSDVLLSLKDIKNRNIDLDISGGSAIEDLNNGFLVSSYGTYDINYSLKGILSINSIKEDKVSCFVRIDKDKPIINVSRNSITLTDGEGSGVKEYFISRDDIGDGHGITEWILYNSSFDIDETSYVYAKDIAGNIAMERVEIDDDTFYPSIMFEPIPNTLSKFKVTIKNVNSSNLYDLDLDSIRVQYDLKSSDFNHSSEVVTYNITTFDENFNYNSSLENNSLPTTLPKNYIDYSKNKNGVCDNKECTFIINMEDFIKYCYENEYCTRIVDFSNLENMDVDYYIYVKNRKGNYTRLQLNSKLNIYIDENAYVDDMREYNYDYYTRIEGINASQDIVYRNCSKDGTTYCNYYYHNNKDNKNYSIGNGTIGSSNSYISGAGNYSTSASSYFKKFDSETIEYSICASGDANGMYTTSSLCYYRWYPREFFKTETKYKYDIKKENLTNLGTTTEEEQLCPNVYGEFSSRKIEEYSEKYSCGTIDTSNMSFKYPATKFNYLPYSNFITSFLDRHNYWYKRRYDSSKRNSYGVDDLLNNSVFTREINGVTYNYILMRYVNNRGDYYRYNLYFIPEVSLITKNLETGRS